MILQQLLVASQILRTTTQELLLVVWIWTKTAMHEVVAQSYDGRVIVYEMNTAANAFDVVWMSPQPDTLGYSYGTRTVNVGDLDGDGKHEIVFPSSDTQAYGFHIYEWDGVVGSDNYGTTFSSVCNLEVDICCAGAVFRGRHEIFEMSDVDGDGQQELISAIRDGSTRGTLIASLAAGDDIVHNSGGSFETWSQEFLTNNNDYGGGSPYHALPVDLNGDGQSMKSVGSSLEQLQLPHYLQQLVLMPMLRQMLVANG